LADVNGLGVAFKEWAVVCEALASGRQAILLRKGGVAEAGGVFRVEHDRFWLYPTYVHQQQGGIVDAARPLLEQAERSRPAAGVVRLSHFAAVAGVEYAEDLEAVLRLAPLHVWSPETVESRFRYRTPGLFVLAVRVCRAAVAHELAETAAYAGCKSWVELASSLDATGEAVLGDAAFAGVLGELGRLGGG
jgi:hypothetical protein